MLFISHVFVRIVTWEQFGFAHAPPFFTKVFEYSYLMCSFILWVGEHFGLAHAPSFSQRLSNIHILCVSPPLLHLFVLWPGERFGLSRAPPFFTKAFEYLYLVCKPSSHAFICLVTWGVIQACPCSSLFHKGICEALGLHHDHPRRRAHQQGYCTVKGITKRKWQEQTKGKGN